MSLADLLVLRPEFRRRPHCMAALENATLRIEQAFPDFGSRATEDVVAVIRRVATALKLNRWDDVTTGDVATALQAFLDEVRPFPDDFRKFLTEEAAATTNPRLLDVMVRAYLETWQAGSTKTRDLRDLIIVKSHKLPIRWQTLFQTCPEFIDIERGPVALGMRMVGTDVPYQWLRAIGLAVPHDRGFMRLAHSAFVKQSPDPRSGAALDKLLSWVTPDGVPALDDNRAAEVVDRILSPWTTDTCPTEFRELCTARLVDRFGDPRRDKPAFWGLVGDANKRVLFKWLARKSMEAMFEVVTAAAPNANSARLWANRKRFWMSLYDAGRIDEAWVVLGKDAIPVARSLYQRTLDKSYLSYGRQAGRSDTSLLLMKVGGKTVVEGSHNFRVHIFPTPSRQTPQLYAETYDLEEIVLPANHDDARSHIGDWMDWVRNRIRA